MMEKEQPVRGKKIKVLVAKPGLDGHDRGAKIISFALRDAGMEIIYSGLHQTIDQIVQTAMQESVDVIGLSIMSGAHMPICENLTKKMHEKGLQDIHVVVGGVIPRKDIPKLKEKGIEGVFPGGTTFEDIVGGIRAVVEGKGA